MFEEAYRRGMEHSGPTGGQLEQMMEVLETQMGKKHLSRALRAALVAAAICAALVTTVAAAYFMGAFGFLKEQGNYAALGQNEVYEKYAYEVGSSATTKDGDVFTVERVAMDGKFCTVFYSIHFQEPVVNDEELKEIQNDGSPDFWKIEGWSSIFTLYADNVEISEEGYNNSFEQQEYLADGKTLYGAWRFLLSRPLEEGETVKMETTTYQNRQPSGAAEIKERLTVDFAAKPIPAEHFTPDVTFGRSIGDGSYSIKIRSLDRSPLGTQLTIREEKIKNYSGLEFALRNADTGAYIPYAEIYTYSEFSEEYETRVFELFGDTSGLENLELIPTRGFGSTSPRIAVSIKDLPATDSGNPAGGYAPASYTAENGKLIVTMKPLGAVNGQYSRILNGVYFLDADGKELFNDIWVQKFKSRADGTITVVSTPGKESFAADVDKVAQIWFFVQQYELLEGQAVKIPLQ